MIKNIPNKYTQRMLLNTIDENFKGTYDFFYLPIDFKNKCNVGYAFINMVQPGYIVPFVQKFDHKKWDKFNSEKVCQISYARIQVRDGGAVLSCCKSVGTAQPYSAQPASSEAIAYAICYTQLQPAQARCTCCTRAFMINSALLQSCVKQLQDASSPKRC